MRKLMIVVYIVFIVLVNSGCSTSNNVLSTTISHINLKANNHKKQLQSYDSPYTICYVNNDGTYSMYIYASPIQYKTDEGYAVIDNTVIVSNKDGFSYENKANEIKTYFPELLNDVFRVERNNEYIEFNINEDVSGFSKVIQKNHNNMYGDNVSAIVYESPSKDIIFYPTRSGIKLEVVLKEKNNTNQINFEVYSSGTSYENKQNGYILFKNEQINSGLIYNPLVAYKDGNEEKLDITSDINIEKSKSGYYVNMSVNQDILDKAVYPIKYEISFELYLNKTPDSNVYSKFYINEYLCNYSVIGEHPDLGEGWQYTRFKLNQLFYTKTKEVIKARFYSRCFYTKESEESIYAYYPAEQWQSTQMLWNSKIEHDTNIVSTSSINKDYIEFDITDFVKQCFMDNTYQKEDWGLIFKGGDRNYYIIASSDNSLYSPYVRIDLLTPPKGFVLKDNIN